MNRAIAWALAAMLALTGCASAEQPSVTHSSTADQLAAAAPPRVTKVLVFVMENHSLAQMKSGMPYTFSQAKRFGYATHYQAVRHPSLPNYLAIASGSTHRITDDKPPRSHRIHGHSVFGQALAAHKTAAVYADGMPRACATTNGTSRYAVRHNPWTYFVDERAACRRHDVAGGRLSAAIERGALPNVGMVVPNTCHDAHDCSLATADAWFKIWMKKIYAGPDWKSGRLAVVLTADEDDRASHNNVLTVVIHRSQHGHVVKTALTHYSVTRLYADVTHTKRLGAAKTAPSLSKAFGLPLK